MKTLQNEKHRNLIDYQQAKTEHARRSAEALDLNTRLEAARADLAQSEQASAQAAAALVVSLRDPLSHAGLGRAITRVWDTDAKVIECQTQVEILEKAMANARSTRQQVQQTPKSVSPARSSHPGASPISWSSKLSNALQLMLGRNP